MDRIDALLLVGWVLGAVGLTAWALATAAPRRRWTPAWAAWLAVGFNLIAWRTGQWSWTAAAGCVALAVAAVGVFVLAALAYEAQARTWQAAGRRAGFWYPFDQWFRKREP